MRRRSFIRLGLAGAIGSVLHNQQLYAQQTFRKSDLMADVLIVGSGPAGLSIADKLSSSGVKVLILESGVESNDPERQSLATVLDGGGMLYELGQASRRVIGGSSLFWGGFSLRMQNGDFNAQSRHGYGVDWPLAIDELLPYYCRAERWLRIGIDRTYYGNTSVGCSVSYASPYEEGAQSFIQQLRQLGINNARAASVGINKASIYSPIRLNQDTGPDVLGRNNVRIIKDATVRRITFDRGDRARGLLFNTFDGLEYEARGGTVILCAGGVQNARLLLLSKNHYHPDGAGNTYGHFGRWFMEHPHVRYWLNTKEPLIDGSDPITLHIGQWYKSHKQKGLGSVLLRLSAYQNVPDNVGTAEKPTGNLLFDCLCEQSPYKNNRISLHPEKRDLYGDPLPKLQYQLRDVDRQTIDSVGTILHPLMDKFAEGGVHREKLAYGSHLMGTTRMSTRPNDGVVDSHQRVHGIDNLYVAGSSVFCTGGAANPTLTLTALSLRSLIILSNGSAWVN